MTVDPPAAEFADNVMRDHVCAWGAAMMKDERGWMPVANISKYPLKFVLQPWRGDRAAADHADVSSRLHVRHRPTVPSARHGEMRSLGHDNSMAPIRDNYAEHA